MEIFVSESAAPAKIVANAVSIFGKRGAKLAETLVEVSALSKKLRALYLCVTTQ